MWTAAGRLLSLFIGAGKAKPPVVLENLEEETMDASVLRLLSESYRQGITKWEFAASLSRLYEGIEARNETLLPDQHITVRIHPAVHQWLNRMVEKGFHIPSDEPGYITSNPLEAADNLIRKEGPKGMPGIYIGMEENYFEGDYSVSQDGGSILRIKGANGKFRDLGLETSPPPRSQNYSSLTISG